MVAVATVKNNAFSTLLTAITAVDVGLSVASGDGTLFPTITASNYYFYMTLESTAGVMEIVKVTARSGDSMTITRAQEGTTAAAFQAGSLVELRVTAQGLTDLITASAISLSGTNSWTGVQTFAGATTEVALSGSAAKLRIWNTALTHYHGLRNVANVFTMDYDATDYLTVSAAGVMSFVSGPLVGAAAIYYAGGTDVALTDGGTGASTASAARTNLGVVIGTDVQAYDAGLLSIAGLTTAADKMIYTTASDVYAVADLSSFARTVLDDTTAAAARATLGVLSMGIQASTAVAVTGGTIAGLTELQGRPKVSAETSGTLTTLSSNTIVNMTGTCTLNASVFTMPDVTLFWAGSSSRTLTQGSGVTMRLAGSATTGSRTLAAYTLASAYWISASEVVIAGGGVS